MPRTSTNRDDLDRALNHLKNWRGLAARYDKYALTYLVSMSLASTMLWLNV